VRPEQVSIIERALAQVDRRGFDPADIDKGEQLLVGFADIHSITELRILAAQVIDRIDPDGTRPKDQLNHDRRHIEFHRCRDGSSTAMSWPMASSGIHMQYEVFRSVVAGAMGRSWTSRRQASARNSSMRWAARWLCSCLAAIRLFLVCSSPRMCRIVRP